MRAVPKSPTRTLAFWVRTVAMAWSRLGRLARKVEAGAAGSWISVRMRTPARRAQYWSSRQAT